MSQQNTNQTPRSWWDFEPQNLWQLTLKIPAQRPTDTSRVFFQGTKFLFVGIFLAAAGHDLAGIRLSQTWQPLLDLLSNIVLGIAIGYQVAAVLVAILGYLYMNLLSQWAAIYAFHVVHLYLSGKVLFAESAKHLVEAILLVGALDVACRLWESRRTSIPRRWRLAWVLRAVGVASALVWAVWSGAVSFGASAEGICVNSYTSGSETLPEVYPTCLAMGMLTGFKMMNSASFGHGYLEEGDYHSEAERIKGEWLGRLSDRLGITGPVENRQLLNLSEGRHPVTEEKLRPRMNKTQNVKYYDMVFSASKSVSIMAKVDERIPEEHDRVVRFAVEYLQDFVDTRVRKDGANELRSTAEAAIATYRHETSRMLDPQLHTHCVIPNMTFDPVENQFKAIHAGRMFEAIPLVTEFFRNEMASALQNLGYEMRPVPYAPGLSPHFEIEGVPQELLDRFSQRSKVRDEEIAKFEAENGRTPTAAEIGEIVRVSRPPKLINITKEEVNRLQFARMTAPEIQLLQSIRDRAIAKGDPRDRPSEFIQPPAEELELEPREMVSEERLEPQASLGPNSGEKALRVRVTGHEKEALKFALEHVFETKTVARKEDILREALAYGRGRVNFEGLRALLSKEISSGRLFEKSGSVATKESLKREERLVEIVNRGIGKFSPMLVKESNRIGRFTSSEMQAALGVLNSNDRVVGLQVAAGTRRAAMVKAIHESVLGLGQKSVVVAPTAAAVDGLRKAGIEDAVSVSRFSAEYKMGLWVMPRVVIVDQAGMMGTEQMEALLKQTEKRGHRVVLTGDTKQLRSVRAGDAFRVLQQDSRMQTFEVTSNVRHEGRLRAALKAFRDDPTLGFSKLTQMGAIRSTTEDTFQLDAAHEYAALLRTTTDEGKTRTVLGIAPTVAAVREFTEAIRTVLKGENLLSRERSHKTLKNLNLSTAQKKDSRNYKPGQYLVFHKATRSAKRGETFKVRAVVAGQIIASHGLNRWIHLGKKQAGCYSVFERTKIQVGKGDKLLLQQNMVSDAGRMFSFKSHFKAGEIVNVKRHDILGRIVLDDGRVLPHDFQQFTYGWAVTPHGAQGRAADSVVVAARAMSREGFYVAASRAKENVSVFAPDSDQFAASVSVNRTRLSAMDLKNEAWSIGPSMEQSKTQSASRGRSIS